jgi:hypothetical protein
MYGSFSPTCAQFPHCTAAPSITKNQTTIISPLAKNSSTNTILSKISSPSLLPTKFVRGNITRFGNSVYFGPYPIDDEFQLLKKNGFNEGRWKCISNYRSKTTSHLVSGPMEGNGFQLAEIQKIYYR